MLSNEGPEPIKGEDKGVVKNEEVEGGDDTAVVTLGPRDAVLAGLVEMAEEM